MNTKRALLVSFLLISSAAGVVLAQQKVPPPPKPPDQGPSLADTMKFVQDKLNGMGPVNYVVFGHDDLAGNDWTAQSEVEVSKVVASPESCSVSFHFTQTKTGTASQIVEGEIPLKAVENIIVMPMEQRLKEVNTSAGHPSCSFRVEPPVFVLKVARSDKAGSNDLVFSDQDLANRLAKAMVHAVELCGGGNKDPF